MRRPILNFLPLVLEVSLNSTLDSVPQSTGVNKTLSKKSLEPTNPRQGIFDCLVPTLVLAPTKADPTAKERSCKRGAVGAKGAGGIDMILALLAEVVTLHMGLPIVEIGEPSLQVAFSVACGFRTVEIVMQSSGIF